MFFETFEEAKKHIEKIWNNPDLWWTSKKVQAARKIYLNNFFKIEKNLVSKLEQSNILFEKQFID